VRMPDIDGNELIAQLRARQPTLKVVCMTGHPGVCTEDEFVSLMKPFTREQLLRAVADALQR
jgi:FixJ family two-component response regulator